METSSENVTDLLFSDDPPEKSLVQDLLFKAFSNIGEPVTGFQSLIWRQVVRRPGILWRPGFLQFRCWNRTIRFDVVIRIRIVSLYGKIDPVWQRQWIDSSARTSIWMCLALGLVKDFQNLEQITFLSFKGLWDQGQQIDEDRKPGNHQLLYYTIRSLINDDQVKFNLRLTESRSQIMEQLQESSLECCIYLHFLILISFCY